MTNIKDKSKFLSGKAITEKQPNAETINPTKGIPTLSFPLTVIGGIIAANIPNGIAAADLKGPLGHAKIGNHKKPKKDIMLTAARTI